MSKRDLLTRNDQRPPVRNGEFVVVGSVTQFQNVTLTGPWPGDFQIVNNGRLIVGPNPDYGPRFVGTTKGVYGYGDGSNQTFSIAFSTDTVAGITAGDAHLGNLSANYLRYNNGDGTLGLYTPAGAGVLLENDGSARFGHADGAHMFWDSSSESLKFITGSGSEAQITAEIDSLGNASFTGTIYANGGRIYGDMQVDAMLRAGDVDGPAVYIGKLVDAGGVAYAGLIQVTDTENVPWFVVRTGDDGTGHLQVGRPGDYPNRLTLDVTETTSTLVFDGTAYLNGGAVVGSVTVDPAGSVTFGTGGEGVLDKQGVSLLSNAAAVPGDKNSYKFTVAGSSTGGLYGYYDSGNSNIFTQLVTSSVGVDSEMSEVAGEYNAYTLIYALAGTAKEGRVSIASVGNDDAYATVGIDITSEATGDAYVALIGGLNYGQTVKTANFNFGYTGSSLHRIHYIIDATGGNVTGTLPDLSGITAGRVYVVSRKDNTGSTVTVQRGGSDTIAGSTSFTMTQYETVMLIGYPGGTVWYKVGL